MKKIIVFLAAVVLSGVFCANVFAEENTATSSASVLIQQLKQQIESLQAQIQNLINQIEIVKQARTEVQETKKELKGTVLQLKTQMREGMTGEEIEKLQEILSTDSEIYPEGLKTGYFGYLTRKAVERFQKRYGIEQVGNVGPKTLKKINEILEEGAGNSGKIPPGLLIAPGILKKLDFTPQPLLGQQLPKGIAKKLGATTTQNGYDEDDNTTPVISGLGAINIASTSAAISWTTNESSDSRVWCGTTTPVDIFVLATLENTGLVLDHSESLSGLTASTTYYCKVSSEDASGNISNSMEFSFSTLAE